MHLKISLIGTMLIGLNPKQTQQTRQQWQVGLAKRSKWIRPIWWHKQVE